LEEGVKKGGKFLHLGKKNRKKGEGSVPLGVSIISREKKPDLLWKGRKFIFLRKKEKQRDIAKRKL